MEKSEPSLVPEWLRSSGGGTGGGSLGHSFASTQADSPLALQKRNLSSKSISNSSAHRYSFLGRSSSINSRKISSSNSSSSHDTNSYIRSYNSSTSNQRNKGRERLGSNDSWDPEYSDSLTSIITGRIEKDPLRRSQSMISRKPDELSQRRVYTDLKNNSINITNGHGTNSVASAGSQKVSFERDFPVLRTDERPTTPDIVRVPSPGLTLSRGIQGMSIGGTPLIGNEGWTSALAEVPTVVGNNCTTSPPTSNQPPYAAATYIALPVYGSTPSAAGVSNGLNMAEALVQTPRSHNSSQLSVHAYRSEELPSLGSKRLIPMTPSPKSLVLNSSDKLKPKTATRTNEVVSGPKNGLQQMSSLQIGSHPVRSATVRADGPKLSSSGKQLLLLKSTRENVLSPFLKDGPTQTVPGVIANGQLTGAPSVNPVNMKLPSNERKTSTRVVDKRLSSAQLRSRNDFFNLVRKKSMSHTSATDNSGSVSSGFQKSDSDELKQVATCEGTLVGNGGELKCNGDARHRESDLDDTEVIHPSEEEEAFLRSLGWDDNTGDEGGLTEEEINAFVQKYMKHKPASKHGQNLQLKVAAESDLPNEEQILQSED